MTIHKVPEDFAALAHLRQADYQRLYQESVKDPNGFWARMGRRIDWIQPYTKVKDTSFDLQDFRKCIASLAVMAYVLADMPGRL